MSKQRILPGTKGAFYNDEMVISCTGDSNTKVYAPSNKILRYMKQKLIEQQGAIEKLRITVAFYTYL